MLYGNLIISIAKRNAKKVAAAATPKKAAKETKTINKNNMIAALVEAGYRVIDSGKRYYQKAHEASVFGLKAALKRVAKRRSMLSELAHICKFIKKNKPALRVELKDWSGSISEFYDRLTVLRDMQQRASEIISLVYGV